MNTVIIAIIIALLAGTIIIFSLIRPSNNANGNQYRKQKKAKQPKRAQKKVSSGLGSSPLPEEKTVEHREPVFGKVSAEDSDSVLGLKQQDKPSADKKPLKAAVDTAPEPTRARAVRTETAASATPAPTKTAQQRSITEPVLLYIKAKPDHSFMGYELLQALLASSLRFGRMNIFHRYEDATGKGAELFSLAAATKEGTFELTKMGQFSCQGLVMFFQLNETADPMVAFKLMLKTAHQLAADLSADVLDEHHQPLSKATALEMQARVFAYQENTVAS